MRDEETRDVNEGGLTSSNALESRRKQWLYHEIYDDRRWRDKTGIRLFVKSFVLLMCRDVITGTEMLDVSLSVEGRNGCSISKGMSGQWSNDQEGPVPLI